MTNLRLALWVPALLGLPGCLTCMHHSETKHALETDGLFEPAAVSGLPAGASSFYLAGGLLALDGDGHVSKSQDGAGDVLVTTEPDEGVETLYVRYDLSALATDITNLGVDMRTFDSASPLIGHEYTVAEEGSAFSTTSTATGSVTVVMGIDTDEAFALDVDFTMPTSTGTPARVSGVVGWKARSYDFDIESGDCS